MIIMIQLITSMRLLLRRTLVHSYHLSSKSHAFTSGAHYFITGSTDPLPASRDDKRETLLFIRSFKLLVFQKPVVLSLVMLM